MWVLTDEIKFYTLERLNPNPKYRLFNNYKPDSIRDQIFSMWRVLLLFCYMFSSKKL